MNIDQLMSVAHAWLSCFDELETYEALLRESGYKAFDAHTAFLNQFADDASDITIHRICYKERAKFRVTAAPVLQTHPLECRSLYYNSPYLETRRLEQARKHEFDDAYQWQRSTLPLWKKEVDPLISAKLRKMHRGQDTHDHYTNVLKDDLRPILENEASCFPRQAVGAFATDRLKIFADASNEFLRPLGFKPVPTRSNIYFAMDVEVGCGEVLRWSLNEENEFFLLSPVEALCQPTLHLRSSSFRKRLRDSDRSSRYLVIPFQLLIEGLTTAYQNCQDGQHVYLNVFVHSVLLKHLLPHIFSAIDIGQTRNR